MVASRLLRARKTILRVRKTPTWRAKICRMKHRVIAIFVDGRRSSVAIFRPLKRRRFSPHHRAAPGTNRPHNQGGFAMKLILKTGLFAAMLFALVGSTPSHAAIHGGTLTLSGCNA